MQLPGVDVGMPVELREQARRATLHRAVDDHRRARLKRVERRRVRGVRTSVMCYPIRIYATD
jgi:hypothetical protein